MLDLHRGHFTGLTEVTAQVGEVDRLGVDERGVVGNLGEGWNCTPPRSSPAAVSFVGAVVTGVVIDISSESWCWLPPEWRRR